MANESHEEDPIKFIEFSLEISLVGKGKEATDDKFEEFCQFMEEQADIDKKKGENPWEICGTSVYDYVNDSAHLRSINITIADPQVIPKIIELVKKFASENGVELGFRN